jgi:hypothetical protein
MLAGSRERPLICSNYRREKKRVQGSFDFSSLFAERIDLLRSG